MTHWIHLFLVCWCRPVIDQNFYYAGLKFTGPTFACAMSNILPAMTFVMAVIFRFVLHHVRSLSMHPWRSRARCELV